MPEAELRRLVLAIRSAIGIEALVWLTDVAGLSRDDAVDLMRWSARALPDRRSPTVVSAPRSSWLREAGVPARSRGGRRHPSMSARRCLAVRDGPVAGSSTNAARYRFRAELRTRWRSWLGLALVVGIAGAAVLALAAGARRTDTAYQRFLREQDAYDVLVSLNTSGFGAPTEVTFDIEELEQLPQVVDTAETASFFITLGAGVGVFVPPNERIGTTINRFKMLDGRRPDPDDPTEVVVGFELAEQYALEVGSTIQVIDDVFLEPPPPEFGLSTEEVAEFEAAGERVLAALPDNEVTIVGIEASPGEFPPQIEGTGRYLIHASPALYPLREDLAVFSEGSDLLMVRLQHGARDTDAFLAELERLGAREGIQLSVQRELAEIVDRSLHTQAVALRLLALLTALAGILIVGQLLARLTFLESTDHPVLSALGMSRRERLAVGLARAATIGVVGAVVAVVRRHRERHRRAPCTARGPHPPCRRVAIGVTG